MKKRLLAALMAGAMALTMTACGGSSSGSDDSNAASGSDSGSAGSYKVGIVQLVQHEALDAATQGFKDKLEELVKADGGSVDFDLQNASGESANCATIVNGFVSDGDNTITVVLDTKLTPELIEEGFVREIISKVQTMRKEADFQVTDKIVISCKDNEKIEQLIKANADQIKSEVLAVDVKFDEANGYVKDWSINGENVTMGVERA